MLIIYRVAGWRFLENPRSLDYIPYANQAPLGLARTSACHVRTARAQYVQCEVQCRSFRSVVVVHDVILTRACLEVIQKNVLALSLLLKVVLTTTDFCFISISLLNGCFWELAAVIFYKLQRY